MATWVVLPTYNEAANIADVIQRVLAIVPAEILVVDDNSPDGTGQIVDHLAATDKHIHIIHRAGKLGFGSAYQDGFQRALERGAETVVQLDADGSHDPVLIPEMISALAQADLVLASRYVSGGRFPIVWHRRVISLIGNWYIRLMLGWAVHDWSTGYKVWRADLLRRVLAEPKQGVGYAWLMETTWIARRLGGRIREIPLVFRERQGGQSKFSWRIAAEDLSLAWKLSHRG